MVAVGYESELPPICLHGASARCAEGYERS